MKPLFAFGHGLSYTSFTYGKPNISGSSLALAGYLKVTVPITNSGNVAGHEIVQFYVKDVKTRIPRPEKELAAFEKIFLQPGETKDVVVKIDKYSVGFYDTKLVAWVAEKGDFTVLVGASSADIRYASIYFLT